MDRDELMVGYMRDLEEVRELRAAAGGTSYAVGDWVKSWDGHLVGEVVEVRPHEEYVVRAPKVAIETSHLHLVSGDDLAAARVEDSHRAMAIDHLEYVLDELVGAGRSDAVQTVWALLKDVAVPPSDRGDGCPGCGSFAHPSGECEGE